jgi:hypothetical protein
MIINYLIKIIIFFHSYLGDHLTLMQNKSIYYKLQTQNRSLAN